MIGRLLIIFFVLSSVANTFAQSPKSVEASLKRYLKEVSDYGNYGSRYNERRLNAANDKIRALLLSGGRTAAILRYSFPKLKGDMYIATSPDGKFRIYSWDLETGGTMHDFASVFQYQGKSGKVYTRAPIDDEESAGSFYTQIFQTDSKRGPIYLANGNFIGSSSLNGQSIEAFAIEGEKFDAKPNVIRTSTGLTNSISFAYDFFSVVDHSERPVRLVFYDPAKREFRFPVIIEDDDALQGRVTNKYIIYRFNNNVFVKVN
ncbi:MAG: hypothetical protein AB7V18_14285 [Pyrinomonadaceae bacterium]